MHTDCIILYHTLEHFAHDTQKRCWTNMRSITEGKDANVLILNAPNWKHIIYQLGNHQNLIEDKIINGTLIK